MKRFDEAKAEFIEARALGAAIERAHELASRLIQERQFAAAKRVVADAFPVIGRRIGLLRNLVRLASARVHRALPTYPPEYKLVQSTGKLLAQTERAAVLFCELAAALDE